MNRAGSGNLLMMPIFAILALTPAVGNAQTASAGIPAPAATSGGASPSSTSASNPQPSDTQTEQQTEAGQAAAGQTPSGQPKTADAPPADRKGEWLFAPIPIKSPAVGSGLQWAVARIFPLNKRDEVSPPSVIGVGGLFTNNGSRAIAVGARLYLKEDKFRLVTAAGSTSINADIYGVGKHSGDNGTFLPMNADGQGLLFEGLYGITKGVYFGLRGQYRRLKLGLDQEKMDSPEIAHEPPQQVADVLSQILPDLTRQQTVSLGPRFQLDTRDSTFYPKRGILLDVNADFFAQGLGSKWSYQYFKAAVNKYTALGQHQVLAFRAMSCAATGSRVPIYDLCLFGAMNDLRGYSAGRYQDHRMFAVQGEYRLMLPVNGFLGRFGVVAFGGVGAVGDKFTNIAAADLLPAGGGGVRFRLLKKQPINFRVDYGMGKVGHTLSVGVLEAF